MSSSHRETVYDRSGNPVEVRDVTERDNGSVRVVTYDAERSWTGGTKATEKTHDRTYYPDGSVYERTGTWPHDSNKEIRSADK